MILSIGDISIDNYVLQKEELIGGIAANFAVQSRQLGDECYLMSAVGTDEAGDYLLKKLKDNHMTTEYVQQIEGTTAEQKIELDHAERKFCGYSAGVLDQFVLRKKDLELLKDAAALVTPLSDGMETVFDQVMEAETSALKVVDFSRDADIKGFEHGDVIGMLKKYIDQIDIVFIGGDHDLLDTTKEYSIKYPKKIFILTLGSDGSVTFQNGESYKQEALPIDNVVDTTGCGDAFRAGFVVEHLRGKSIAEALQKGAELAANVATHVGGVAI